MLKKTALKAAFQYWEKGDFSIAFWDEDIWKAGSGKEKFKIISVGVL